MLTNDVRVTKADGGNAEYDDRPKHLGTDIVLQRFEGEIDGDDRCAKCWSSTKLAQSIWADMKDIARINRQQRGSAREQHSEQI